MSKHVVLTRKAAMTLGALHGFLKPRLAQDAKINLVPILSKLTSKNFGTQKPFVLKNVTTALDGKLAKDASVEGLATLLDALEEEKAMDDPLPLETEMNGGLPPDDASMDDEGAGPDAGAHAAILEFLQGKISDEDMAAVQSIIAGEAGDEDKDEKKAEEGEDEDMDDDEDKKDKKPFGDKGAKDEPPPFKGKPEVGGGMSKDSVNKAIAAAVKDARVQAGAVREAEHFVQQWVGNLALACDSAEEVYKTALKAMGVDVKGVHPSAYRSILEHVPRPSSKTVDTTLATDSAAMSDFAKRFPEVARIKFA